MNSTVGPEKDRLEWLSIVCGVYGVLALFFLFIVVTEPQGVPIRGLDAAILLLLTVAYFSVLFGLPARPKWCFWVALMAFGFPALAISGVFVGTLVDEALFSDPHAPPMGHGRVYCGAPCFGILFWAPTVMLVRSWKAFR